MAGKGLVCGEGGWGEGGGVIVIVIGRLDFSYGEGCGVFVVYV